MKIFTPFLILFILGTGTIAAQSAMASSDPVYTSWRNNLALSGYDPISFFNGRPVEGLPKYETRYKGVAWRFSTQAHLDLFNANPVAFEPQFGGYCAWAVAMGKLAKGSPNFWYVKDGKLYLNFNARIQEKWDKDRLGFIQKADQNWPEILE